MATKWRAVWISLFWAIGVALLAWHFVVRRVPAEPADEHGKWVLAGLLAIGLHWLPTLAMVLVIALSFNGRCNRARIWILSIWALIVLGVAYQFFQGFSVLQPTWSSVTVFASHRLFACLVGLWVAFLIEREASRAAQHPTSQSVMKK